MQGWLKCARNCLQVLLKWCFIVSRPSWPWPLGPLSLWLETAVYTVCHVHIVIAMNPNSDYCLSPSSLLIYIRLEGMYLAQHSARFRLVIFCFFSSSDRQRPPAEPRVSSEPELRRVSPPTAHPVLPAVARPRPPLSACLLHLCPRPAPRWVGCLLAALHLIGIDWGPGPKWGYRFQSVAWEIGAEWCCRL